MTREDRLFLRQQAMASIERRCASFFEEKIVELVNDCEAAEQRAERQQVRADNIATAFGMCCKERDDAIKRAERAEAALLSLRPEDSHHAGRCSALDGGECDCERGARRAVIDAALEATEKETR